MSSLSQEESRSISENVKWGHRKKFESGKYSLTYSRFLGYDKGEDGTLVINESEAPIIREIYSDFLLGLSTNTIARKLTDERIPTPSGKEKWSPNTVRSILQNEKYAGSALLQKTFVADFLTKRTVKNRGELPQYFIEKDHEAIIDPAQFQRVQEIIREREGKGKRAGTSIFASKIRCGQCDSWYGPKVWHSTDQYRRVIWQCNSKFKDQTRCRTPHLTEKQIEEAFVKAVNTLLTEKGYYLGELSSIMDALSDTSALEAERASLDLQIESEALTIREAVAENAHIAQDQEAFRKKYEEMVAKYNSLISQRDAIQSQIDEKIARREKIGRFIRQVEALPALITDFDAALWAALIESVTVETDGRIVFRLSCGTEIE